MVIKTWLPRPIAAITIFPFILIRPGCEKALPHEMIHFAQQQAWAIRGLGVGLLAWFFLYLLALPFHWNPWRRKWETEAFLGDGHRPGDIPGILRKAPYWLK